MSHPLPPPQSHGFLSAHLKAIEAELAFIVNLRQVQAEIPTIPAAEIMGRVQWCWAGIRLHLREALLIAEREEESVVHQRPAAEDEAK